MTTRSGCGMWRAAPRPAASKGTPVRSPRCACCPRAAASPSGSVDGTIRLWDVATGGGDRRLVGGNAGAVLGALCVLPGRGASPRFALPTGRSGCGTWRAAPRPPASKGSRQLGHARCACLRPDGPPLPRVDDNLIRLWDVAARRRGRPPRGARSEPSPRCCRACQDGRPSPRARADEHDPAVGRGRRAPRPPASRDTRGRSPRCACCRTDASPRALVTTRSGCGTWRAAPRPPASKGTPIGSPRCACCPTAASPRALVTTRSGCGTWRAAPRPPASKGTPIGSPRCACCPTAASPWGSAQRDDPAVGFLATAAETGRLEGHAGAVKALCRLDDGRLASGSADGTIRRWDAATAAETARLEGHTGWINTLCRLENGRLASGSSDGKILLWDVATGAETGRLEGRGGHVLALCLLEDGRLASGSGDVTISLWDVAARAETGGLSGNAGHVFALCRISGRLALAV